MIHFKSGSKFCTDYCNNSVGNLKYEQLPFSIDKFLLVFRFNVTSAFHDKLKNRNA